MYQLSYSYSYSYSYKKKAKSKTTWIEIYKTPTLYTMFDLDKPSVKLTENRCFGPPKCEHKSS